MDFALTEEQEMLRKTAREFLTQECSPKLVQQMEADALGYSPALWQKMAKLGWTGLLIPEAYGGTDGNLLDFVVLLEEMGRALVPGPFVHTLIDCGLPILLAGTQEQRDFFLPRIAKGETTMSLLLTEAAAEYTAEGVTMQSTRKNGSYVLSGRKMFAQFAQAVGYFLVVTRSQTREAEDAFTLLFVDAKTPGLELTPLKTIASSHQYKVAFNAVSVPTEKVLGNAPLGWDVLEKTLQHSAVAQCALMLGGAQQVLDMTVDYAKIRVQFGQTIGSFQAIQHRCADVATLIDGAKYLTYEAAWRLSQGLPARKQVSMAKAWTSNAYRWACLEGHQFHGGVGIIMDHPMQLYLRRSKEQELALGDPAFHKLIVANDLGFDVSKV